MDEPCASHNTGRETVEYGPVSEYEAPRAIIPFVGIIIQKSMSCDISTTPLLLVCM
jgi:hypothetical protein